IQPYVQFSRIRLSDHHSPRGVRRVPDAATADVDESHRIELGIRVALPPGSALAVALREVPAHPQVDEALEPPKRLRRVRVLEIVHPASDRVVDALEDLRRLHRCPSVREASDLLTDALLAVLRGKNVEASPSRRRTSTPDKVEAQKVKSLLDPHGAGFVRMQGQSHSADQRRERLVGSTGIATTQKHHVVSIAIELGPEFLGIAPSLPE